MRAAGRPGGPPSGRPLAALRAATFLRGRPDGMAALVAAGRPAGRPSGRRAAAFSKGGRVAALFCVSAGRRQTGEVVAMATSTVAERLDSAALEIAGAWLAKREADVADVERVYAHSAQVAHLNRGPAARPPRGRPLGHPGWPPSRAAATFGPPSLLRVAALRAARPPAGRPSGRPIWGGGRPLFSAGPPDPGQRAARFGGWAALVAAGRPAHHLRRIPPLTAQRFLASFENMKIK